VNQDSDHVNFGPSDNTWDLNFTDEVPLDLRVDMGAGQGNLKLRVWTSPELNFTWERGKWLWI